MLLHAAPAQLHANLHYIANFRHPSRLVGEASYYLTNALSAASFLAELTAAQLTIDAADFEARLDEARRTAATLSTPPPVRPSRAVSTNM